MHDDNGNLTKIHYPIKIASLCISLVFVPFSPDFFSNLSFPFLSGLKKNSFLLGEEVNIQNPFHDVDCSLSSAYSIRFTPYVSLVSWPIWSVSFWCHLLSMFVLIAKNMNQLRWIMDSSFYSFSLKARRLIQQGRTGVESLSVPRMGDRSFLITPPLLVMQCTKNLCFPEMFPPWF